MQRTTSARVATEGPEAAARARLMLYSHDGFGLGHFRRNLLLAEAAIRRCGEANVLLACSAEGAEDFELPERTDLLRLPALRKLGNGHYVGRRLSIATDEMHALRGALLEAAVASFRPHVLLADKHPAGVGGELLLALRRLRADGGRAVLGLRDVLDDPATPGEWSTAEQIRLIDEWHDMVLVYGCPDVQTPINIDRLPARVAAKLRHTGYVVADALPPARDDLPRGDGRPVVLATVGGGEDGLPMLESFLAAATDMSWSAVVVAGPQMSTSHWLLLRRSALAVGARPYRSIPLLPGWMARADAVVCMGGYNTLVEAIAVGTPTVCVPRTHPRREQLVRARAFAERGLIRIIEPEALSPARLRSAIEAALTSPRSMLAARARDTLDLDGARRSATLLLELAGGTLDGDAAQPLHSRVA